LAIGLHLGCGMTGLLKRGPFGRDISYSKLGSGARAVGLVPGFGKYL